MLIVYIVYNCLEGWLHIHIIAYFFFYPVLLIIVFLRQKSFKISSDFLESTHYSQGQHWISKVASWLFTHAETTRCECCLQAHRLTSPDQELTLHTCSTSSYTEKRFSGHAVSVATVQVCWPDRRHHNRYLLYLQSRAWSWTHPSSS